MIKIILATIIYFVTLNNIKIEVIKTNYQFNNEVEITAVIKNPDRYSGRIKIECQCLNKNSQIIGKREVEREIIKSEHEIDLHITNDNIKDKACNRFHFIVSPVKFIRR